MGWLPFEYAVRNLGRAPTRTVGTIAGHVLVVGLVLAAGSFVRGMEQSLTVSSNLRNVILLGAGSEESLERSQIGMNVATLVNASVPGIKTVLGEAYISHGQHGFGNETLVRV
jgi:putative ABC transport system permease protein